MDFIQEVVNTFFSILTKIIASWLEALYFPVVGIFGEIYTCRQTHCDITDFTYAMIGQCLAISTYAVLAFGTIMIICEIVSGKTRRDSTPPEDEKKDR